MTLSRQTRARIAWLLSFLKRKWTLADYPVDYIDQGDFAISPSKRHPHSCWRADLLGLPHLSGLGDTREQALGDAQQKFATYLASGAELRRPGSKPKVIFATDLEVSRFPDLRDHFIIHVLDLEWAFLSDESTLWDFHGELDNAALYHRIGVVYGVDVSHIPNANIAAILAGIMKEIVEFPEDTIVRAIREGREARAHHVYGLPPLSWRPYD
jgi:hypothetical protein